MKGVKCIMDIKKSENKFYVYEHRQNDSGEIFYIGKGTGRRVNNSNSRNPYWTNIVEKHGGFTSRIIEDGMSESAAHQLEIAVIDFYRWAGVRLCNLTDGGDGVSGIKWTEERRVKTSASIKLSQQSDSFKEKVALIHGSTEFKEKQAAITKLQFENPEYRKKHSEGVRKASAKPDVQKRHKEALKIAFQRPDVKAKMLLRVNTPENKLRLSLATITRNIQKHKFVEETGYSGDFRKITNAMMESI